MADIHGTFDERFAPVADVLSANLDRGADVGASVCVVHDGKTVVDIWGGTIDEDGTPNFDRFNAANGWEYRSESIDGRFHNVCLAPEPTPNNVAYIWYAPNHVRAFRREAYEAVGGYDATLEVLDDQDLMMRLFRVGDFHRIPRCLYLQRMHPHNTQRDARINSFIQTDTVARYWDGIADLAVSWANRRGLSVFDLSTAGSVGRTSQGAHRVVVDPDQPITVEDVIWTYEEPYPAVAEIAGHVAFYPDKAEVSVEAA